MEPKRRTSKQPPHGDAAPPSAPKSRRRDRAVARKRDGDGSPYADARTLIEIASSSDRLSTFARAIRDAGLADVLSGTGPLTVFAPTNVAFEKIPSIELTALLADRPRLAQVLKQHVVQGRVRAPQPNTPGSHTSLAGGALTVIAQTGAYRVNDAKLVRTNMHASNGVIHAIDTVLLTG